MLQRFDVDGGFARYTLVDTNSSHLQRTLQPDFDTYSGTKLQAKTKQRTTCTVPGELKQQQQQKISVQKQLLSEKTLPFTSFLKV